MNKHLEDAMQVVQEALIAELRQVEQRRAELSSTLHNLDKQRALWNERGNRQ